MKNTKRMALLLLLTLLCLGCSQSSPQKATSPTPVALEEAPVMEVTDQDGQTLNLSELYEKNLVLVYFYPKADTPGCTAQACSLRDSYAVLTDKGVKVVGVSLDDPKAQKAFKEKYELPFTLVSDQEGVLADAFQVTHSGGFASRQAFLIQDGKVIWHDATASTAKQAEDVLAQLKSLNK